MSELWQRIGKTWSMMASPFRPHPQDVEVMKRELEPDGADVLLLGVTPEFTEFGTMLIAVDAGPHMIGALWVGDNERRRAVVGNWMELPLVDQSVDVVVGDGCLSAVQTTQQREKVLSEVARVLRPGGRAGIRLFVPADQPETDEVIMANLAAKKYANCTEVMLRLVVTTPTVGRDHAFRFEDVMERLNKAYPDRATLLADAGWPAANADYFVTFDKSNTVFSWPPVSLVIEEASRHFNEVRIDRSCDYSASEFCPILILRDPKR